MDISTINSQSLLRLLALTERKEELLKLIDEIDAAIIDSLRGNRAAVEVVKVTTFQAPSAQVKSEKRGRPAKKVKSEKAPKPVKVGRAGGLKVRVLAALEEVGSEGIKIKELADKLGIKPGNLSVWFSTTGRALTNKIEPGRFALKGAKAPVAARDIAPAKVEAAPKDEVKNGISPEGRAKIAAAAKARWEKARLAKSEGRSPKAIKKIKW